MPEPAHCLRRTEVTGGVEFGFGALPVGSGDYRVCRALKSRLFSHINYE